MPVKQKKNPRVFLFIFIADLLIVTLFPFFWIINMSIQNNIQLYDYPPNFFPPKPAPGNFKSLLFEERGMMKFHQAYGAFQSGYAAIFPVILALIFQKYLVRGLTAGGVKG